MKVVKAVLLVLIFASIANAQLVIDPTSGSGGGGSSYTGGDGIDITGTIISVDETFAFDWTGSNTFSFGTVTFTGTTSSYHKFTGSAGDSTLWTGLLSDGGADNDDFFVIGDGSTPGTTPVFKFRTAAGGTTPGNLKDFTINLEGDGSGDYSKVIIGPNAIDNRFEFRYSKGGTGQTRSFFYVNDTGHQFYGFPIQFNEQFEWANEVYRPAVDNSYYLGAPTRRFREFWTVNAYFGSNIEAVTDSKTPDVNESNETYTNTGETGGITITLPNDPAVSAQYHFGATVAQTITIQPSAGETLYSADSACASISFNGIGETVSVKTLTTGSGAIWAVTSHEGTITCTP